MVRAAGNAPALWPCAAPPEAGASLLGYALGKMDGHQSIAPCIPVWKVLADGHPACISQHLCPVESRTGVAPVSAALQAAALMAVRSTSANGTESKARADTPGSRSR